MLFLLLASQIQTQITTKIIKTQKFKDTKKTHTQN